MEMTDLQAKDQWSALEQAICKRFHISGKVQDASGKSVTGQALWCNRFCPAFRECPGAVPAVCAVAHQTLSTQARQSGQTIIDACDLGLSKICVPIIVQGEFLGVIGGCGFLSQGNELDAFLAHKISSLTDETIADLAEDIPRMDEAKERELIRFLEDEVKHIVEKPSTRS